MERTREERKRLMKLKLQKCLRKLKEGTAEQRAHQNLLREYMAPEDVEEEDAREALLMIRV